MHTDFSETGTVPQRYLVTGCAGFIGAAVCRRLVRRGHEVLGVDNLNREYDPRMKRWRLYDLSPRHNFTFRAADVHCQAQLEPLFEAAGPFAGVLHLAGTSGSSASYEQPQQTSQQSIEATLNLLELCRQRQVPKFVLASSSAVYGNACTTPFREDAALSAPASPFAAACQACESLAHAYHHSYGLDVSVLRYSSVYGPAGRPDNSIFRLVRWITEGETVQIQGDGRQIRDFTFIDDVARGTVAALAPLGLEIINLGGNHPLSLEEVVERLETILEQRAALEYLPFRPAEMPSRWSDVTRARRLLGWESTTSIDEGLVRTCQWYQRNRPLAVQLDLGMAQVELAGAA